MPNLGVKEGISHMCACFTELQQQQQQQQEQQQHNLKATNTTPTITRSKQTKVSHTMLVKSWKVNEAKHMGTQLVPGGFAI